MERLKLIGLAVVAAILIFIGVRMRNIELTARIAWGEARNQGDEGLQAVINVIDNRARMDLFNDNKPDWWGETHAGVATKKGQFSAYNDNDPNKPLLLAVTDDDPIFVKAVELAARAVGGDLPDITGGATHYHTTALTPPNWTEGATVTAIIGDHIFYKGVA